MTKKIKYSKVRLRGPEMPKILPVDMRRWSWGPCIHRLDLRLRPLEASMEDGSHRQAHEIEMEDPTLGNALNAKEANSIEVGAEDNLESSQIHKRQTGPLCMKPGSFSSCPWKGQVDPLCEDQPDKIVQTRTNLGSKSELKFTILL
jgi:hypothetical protein